MQKIDEGLKERGVIGDERQPDVIRLAPNPFYNSFRDCKCAAVALKEAFDEINGQGASPSNLSKP
ncbi:hypothetical protein M422DRAFT_263240 [Sphaerobolus stellatus SS14]|uniref:Kynureninase n=1 Tax=Sphaerobolus stellatus (strain SS14) TaxID=990650 RepID=A0A0C9UIH4_SPHS4|nr:hypothetical protein M422DRAFT_263240 [Sphaerobolus stellatus SS14]